jgi:hypothetical protein
MNTVTKLFTAVLFFVLSFGIFFTGNIYASNTTSTSMSTLTDEFRRERVCIDGVWYIIVYDQDGGIVEVIISNNE